MKVTAWSSLKTSWPRLGLGQRVIIVAFFPLIMGFLVMIAWGWNHYGRDPNQADH